MIVDYQKLDLFDKPLFEKVVTKGEMAMPRVMQASACFFYLLEGSQDVYSATGTDCLVASESMLMKCGTFVGKGKPSQTSGQSHGVGIHFHPDVLKQLYENDPPEFLKTSEPLGNASMAKVPADELLGRFIDGMLFYFDNPTLVTEELLKLKLKELILLLWNTRNAPDLRQILTNMFNTQTFEFREVIEAHLYDDISVDVLASLTNQSLSSFKRKFKSIYNASPASYIRSEKLKKAKQLIEQGHDKISHIAYDCGFNDVAHFSKAFKSKYGSSPSAFRP